MKNFLVQVFVIGIPSSIAALGFGVAIKWALGESISRSDLYITVIALFAIIIAFTGLFFRTRFIGWIWRPIERRTGVTKVFRGFRSCEQEIISEMARANSVRIFVQIGTSVLVENKTLYDHLENVLGRDVTFKILHATDSSPHLNSTVAEKRQSSREKWIKDITHARIQLRFLEQVHGTKLSAREHKEPYLVRAFLFDNVAYVQPYLYAKGNSDKALVFKIAGEHTWETGHISNEQSLYHLISKYFDHIWSNSVESRSTAALVPAGASVCATGVFRFKNCYVFVVPMRGSVESGVDGPIPFHFPGGKVLAHERWAETAAREVEEETGLRIELVSNPHTFISVPGEETRRINNSDAVGPSWIFLRSTGNVPWIVSFDAKAVSRSTPEARAETAAVLLLTPQALRRSLSTGGITLNEILAGKDGCSAILREGFPVDLSKRVVPSGLAAQLAPFLIDSRRSNTSDTLPRSPSPVTTNKKSKRQHRR